MKYRDRKVNSIGDFVCALKDQTISNELIWFRGQTSSSWGLVPSLGRRNMNIEAELALIKRFKQNAFPHLAQRPQTEWEWLFLMQHHHLPTRLLDWTESPLAALFFAVEADRKHEKRDSAIWCLLPIELNRHASIEYTFETEIPAFDNDEILKLYLPSAIAGETTSQLFPIAAIASRNSPRIVAQQGTFTVFHRKMTPIEQVGDASHVWRFIIPSRSKQKLRQELKLLNFTDLVLFPELDKVAADARRILQ